jgi:ParB family chromosome partitioning protein
MKIPIDLILPNPEQPRTVFDPTELADLAKSIQANGLIQPIVVEDAGGQYILHDGERRLRAARLAGLSEIEAVIVPPFNGTASEDRLTRALVANLQRSDLNPIEEARAYGRMHSEMGMTAQQIADRTGVKYSRITQRLLLLTLDPEIQELIAQGKLHHSHVVVSAIRSIPERDVRIRFARRAADHRLGIPGIVKAASTLAARQSQEKANPVSGVPAIAYGRSWACQTLDRPHWDALSQAGRVPPWPVVEQAAQAACGECALRDMASPETCGACPLPQALAKMIDLAMQPAVLPINQRPRK